MSLHQFGAYTEFFGISHFLLRIMLPQQRRLNGLSDEFYTSVGYELADAKLMGPTLEDIFHRQGGKSKAVCQIFDSFCGKYPSLGGF